MRERQALGFPVQQLFGALTLCPRMVCRTAHNINVIRDLYLDNRGVPGSYLITTLKNERYFWKRDYQEELSYCGTSGLA